MATIEKVLSIKFPFPRDLGIGSNSFYHPFHYGENDPTKKGILQYEITRRKFILIKKTKQKDIVFLFNTKRFHIQIVLFYITGLEKTKKEILEPDSIVYQRKKLF